MSFCPQKFETELAAAGHVQSSARYERRILGFEGKSHRTWLEKRGLALEGPGSLKQIEAAIRGQTLSSSDSKP